MREARFARARAYAAGQTTPTAAQAPARPATRPPAPAAVETDAAEPTADEARCGHRNMSGRTCTREAGHPQKNHRYS